MNNGEALPPPLVSFVLQYAIRKLKKINLGLDTKHTYRALICAVDVILTGVDIGGIERNVDLYVGYRPKNENNDK